MSTTVPETFPPRLPQGELGVMPDRPALTDSFTPLDLLNVLLRRWRKVAAAPLVAIVLTAAAAFLIPPTYTATTAFVPEVRGQSSLPAGLTSLTGQLGLSLGGQPSQSPQFYASVLTSRELLERLLLSYYADPRRAAGASDSTTLLRILGVKGRTSVRRAASVPTNSPCCRRGTTKNVRALPPEPSIGNSFCARASGTWSAPCSRTQRIHGSSISSSTTPTGMGTEPK